MASASSQKKRKRDDADDGDKVSFRLSSQPASQLGPVLVSFPAHQPSKSTPFRCYLSESTKDGDEEFATRPTIVAAETDSVEFFSTFGEAQNVGGGGCRYLIGVHNKRTKTTVLRPAPLHILARRVKALKHIQPGEVSDLQRAQARAALGQTFGTKKAKAAIRARERNKVDVSAMEDVAGHLQERIEMNTGALPTQEEAKATADSSRLIPRHNADADNPADVYPLHEIIPHAEWRVLSVSALSSAKSDVGRAKMLPYSRSTWVNKHLDAESSRANKHNLKILYYISVMMAFRAISFKKIIDQEKLPERLAGVPSVVVDGLLARFTESSRGSTEARSTTQTETSLLTHLFALCLRIDNYATDTTTVAADLNMSVVKVNQLFRSLGCKIQKLKAKELSSLGLSDSEGDKKRAVLMVPVEFPQTSKRRK